VTAPLVSFRADLIQLDAALFVDRAVRSEDGAHGAETWLSWTRPDSALLGHSARSPHGGW
jgi:hypothetical protein